MPRGLREAAMAETPEMLKVLVKIAKDEKAPPSARVSAAESVISRAYGKAPQSMDMNVNVNQSIGDFIQHAQSLGAAKGTPSKVRH